MTTFKLDHAVTVKNVNGTNEHHGDDEKLLATLSVQGQFQVEDIQTLFGIDDMDAEAFKKIFWDKKGNRKTEKNHSISPCKNCTLRCWSTRPQPRQRNKSLYPSRPE